MSDNGKKVRIHNFHGKKARLVQIASIYTIVSYIIFKGSENSNHCVRNALLDEHRGEALRHRECADGGGQPVVAA
jgi:hypothetical protein